MAAASANTWYDNAYRPAFQRYDDECPFDLCTFLCNAETAGGSLMAWGLPMVRYGCKTLEQLKTMPEADVRAMGLAIGMTPAHVQRVLELRGEGDPRFVMPAPLDPAYDYFMTQVEMLFIQTDADGSGDLDKDELLRIFEKQEMVSSLLESEWMDADRSGTIDLDELKKIFGAIWDNAGEETSLKILSDIRRARY